MSIAQIYQIKIALRDSRPPVWRRLLVSSDMTLARLHRIIQEAMGWYDSHMHQFIVGGIYYSLPYEEMDVEDERHVKLGALVPHEGFKFVYEYDFGDGWQHDVVVEKILAPDPKQKLPVCIKGKRACPPEDVGGVWGYDTFLEAIRDPQHPEHEMYTEWIGGQFDPEAFDLDAVNARLRSLG